jgi:DNA polymerase-1
MSSTPDLTGCTVWVVDTLSRIYQLFHALPEMTSPQGEPVSAVYGFARDLLEIITRRKPDYLFCGMDAPGPTFRHEAFDAYKATRSEMPADLVPQIPLVRRLTEVMQVPLLEQPGFEADDVLATLAKKTADSGGTCILATSDKDARQLLSDQVRLYNLRNGSEYGREELLQEWGIAPEQVVDFLSLVGDSVDNVPGIPLIGPKIASQLLQQYGTLDAVLANADQVAGKKRSQNLRQHADTARASRELVQLHLDVPCEIPWEAGRVKTPPVDDVVAFLKEMGFKSLVNDAQQKLAGNVFSPSRRSAEPAAGPTLFEAQQAHKPADAAAVVRLVEAAHRSGRISLAAVAADARPVGSAHGMVLAVPEADGPPFTAWLTPEFLSGHADAAKSIRDCLADPSVTVHAHDLKRQVVLAFPLGLPVCMRGFDTLVAAYLLDAGQRTYGLADLAARLGVAAATAMPLTDSTGTPEEAAAVATTVLAVAGPAAAALKKAGLEDLFQQVEMPLVRILADMEICGVRVDAGMLRRLSQTYAARLAALEGEIAELAGHSFLISSPRQVSRVLFEELHLPVVKKTKTGPSTDAEVLAELAPRHPIVGKLLEHRQFTKLKSTYVDSLPQLIDPSTGHIHAFFNQTVAATGRLSSSNPNLQNIPIRTREGREIRAAFLPSQEDWLFVAADYSQIELRVLAHLSGDPAMQAAFEAGEDIHTRTAMAVFNADREAITSDMRRVAKAVNFGILYGQSGFGLAKALSITQLEASAFIETYFRTFAGAAAFIDTVLDSCLHDRCVKTLLGRRRAVEGVRPRESRRTSSGAFSLTLPERTAINTVVQGSAADLIKLAMLAVARELRACRLSCNLVLQIHDELVLECPRDELSDVRNLVEKAMRSAMTLSVPLEVSVHDGRSLDDCDKGGTA